MVHHADVAQAIMLAADRREAGGKIYNVADDQPVTAAEIFQLNGITPEEAESQVVEDPWEGIVDTSRIREELGFRPVYPSVYDAKQAGAL